MIELEVLGNDPIELEVIMPTGGGGGTVINNQNKTVTPTASTQQVTADAGYTGLGTVTVNPMPSGHIDEVGTLKSVSNHTATITPYVVIDEAGYFADGEVQGASETVTASELVSGTKQISANGSDIDVTDYESVDVSVPNSYTASDEGKVVSNGALVAQGSQTITENGTYDTTLVDDVTVNVSGGSSFDFLDKTEPQGALTTNLTAIPAYIAYGRTGITSVSAPNATTIGANAFNSCSNLETVYLPEVNLRQSGTIFQNCTKLVGAVFPKSLFVFNSCFSGCTNFRYFDFLGANDNQAINDSAFNKCTNFTLFIIRRTASVVPLRNINNFNNTPFASGGTGGTLYVPQALISSYQSATNWSTILGYTNNSIQAIEGSIYETQYADGTPIS